MIRQIWRGLLDRLEGHREGRAENLNGASAEQFVRELREAPDIIDLRGEPSLPLIEMSAPDVMMSDPAPRAARGGKHRLPGPVTVTFPALSATLPRVTPSCGTRPPWDTAEIPVSGDEPGQPRILGEAELADFGEKFRAALTGEGEEAPRPADPDDPGTMAGSASPDNGDRPGRADDELQEYLDGLPRYPDD